MESTMRVLIGYDGSENAEKVIEDLKWAGLPRKCTVNVLSVADVFLLPAPDAFTPPQIRLAIEKSRERARETIRIAQSLSEHGAQEVKKAMPEWDVFPEACADSPAWALVKKADELQPDLMVVGAHGHSKLGRFLGSVSQMVLVHASHSVRIARPRPHSSSERIRILIGVDGSAGAQAAIDAVAKRTWLSQADIFLLSVIEPKTPVLMKHMIPPDVQASLEKADDERTALGYILEHYAKELRKQGATVTYRVETGDPKKILVEQAETWRADSILMGARGLGNFKRFLIGGVSAAVAARAHCSVEVIRS